MSTTAFWLLFTLLCVTISSSLAVKCHTCSAVYQESPIGGLVYHDTCTNRENWGETNCEGLTDHCGFRSFNSSVAGSKYLVSFIDQLSSLKEGIKADQIIFLYSVSIHRQSKLCNCKLLWSSNRTERKVWSLQQRFLQCQFSDITGAVCYHTADVPHPHPETCLNIFSNWSLILS